MTTTSIPSIDTLTPGDAFTVYALDGIQAEALYWGRDADGRLIVTWASRGVRGFKAEEGPKPSGAPWLMTVGGYEYGPNDIVGIRWSGVRMEGWILGTSGRYQARDEGANGISVMAGRFGREVQR